MGIAFAQYKEGEWNKVVVVANYYPAGNIMKAFEDNVKKAKDDDCNDEKKSEKSKSGKKSSRSTKSK